MAKQGAERHRGAQHHGLGPKLRTVGASAVGSHVRRAVLLFNPVAGRYPGRRLRQIMEVTAALQRHGLTAEPVPTRAPGSAGEQAAEACRNGADLVFACGGDGTLHEVLQGMVHQKHAVLGVIPLGTANVVARHLRLPLDPVRAAVRQLGYRPRLLPVGRIFYATLEGEASRYFLAVAGAGADGLLVYRMLAAGKRRWGRLAYYFRAAGLLLRGSFPVFDVHLQLGVEPRRHLAVSAAVSRVGSLGGLFRPLAPRASLTDEGMALTVVHPPASLALPAWFGLGWSGLNAYNPWLTRFEANGFVCGPGLTGRVPVQADGEWLGHTPMRVQTVPDAVRLLSPTKPTWR